MWSVILSFSLYFNWMGLCEFEFSVSECHTSKDHKIQDSQEQELLSDLWKFKDLATKLLEHTPRSLWRTSSHTEGRVCPTSASMNTSQSSESSIIQDSRYAKMSDIRRAATNKHRQHASSLQASPRCWSPTVHLVHAQELPVCPTIQVRTWPKSPPILKMFKFNSHPHE